MSTETLKIRNGTITLPQKLLRTWREADVFVFPSNDTLIVKKVQEPLDVAWDEYEEKIKSGSRKIRSSLIKQAVAWVKTRS